MNSLRRAVAAAFLLALAPVNAVAQDQTGNPAVEEGGECFPKCRTGYICHQGACIELCNPPCASNESCTAEGECVSKEHGAPPLTVVTKPTPSQMIDSVETAKKPEEIAVSDETPDKGEKETSEHTGIIAGLGGGAGVCASSAGCNTFKRGDFGADVHILGGYRLLNWLVVEGAVTYTHLFIAEEDGDANTDTQTVAETETDRTDFLLAARAGARFFPLGRRRFIEPVLGLHTGYVMNYAKVGNNKDRAHGLNLDYVIGVDFKFTEVFSLGIEAAIYEPIWITTCSERESAFDAEGNEIFAADDGCFKFDGKRDLFFFNFATQATLFF